MIYDISLKRLVRAQMNNHDVGHSYFYGMRYDIDEEFALFLAAVGKKRK